MEQGIVDLRRLTKEESRMLILISLIVSLASVIGVPVLIWYAVNPQGFWQSFALLVAIAMLWESWVAPFCGIWLFAVLTKAFRD